MTPVKVWFKLDLLPFDSIKSGMVCINDVITIIANYKYIDSSYNY